VLVPLTQFWSQWVQLGDALSFVWALGIDDDYVGIIELVITHVAYGLPICTLLFRTYYKTMSDEMIESARLDGATLRRVYRRIVLPLSGPMFAVVLIYQFTQIWNDLLFTLVIVSTGSSPAAPVVLILAGLGSSLEGQDFAPGWPGILRGAADACGVHPLRRGVRRGGGGVTRTPTPSSDGTRPRRGRPGCDAARRANDHTTPTTTHRYGNA